MKNIASAGQQLTTAAEQHDTDENKLLTSDAVTTTTTMTENQNQLLNNTIVHRSLSPATIMVRNDGEQKSTSRSMLYDNDESELIVLREMYEKLRRDNERKRAQTEELNNQVCYDRVGSNEATTTMEGILTHVFLSFRFCVHHV